MNWFKKLFRKPAPPHTIRQEIIGVQPMKPVTGLAFAVKYEFQGYKFKNEEKLKIWQNMKKDSHDRTNGK